ncbi:MAG: hypothetical protein UU47_C0020G0002 [candidate division TM6 bacterium GW2011_GWE2_41_16]|nr:MAG: hypothetical protein UU47_C0020G0002 [candidate division TM6 bacterium GW2011_GWE2_41_16]
MTKNIPLRIKLRRTGWCSCILCVLCTESMGMQQQTPQTLHPWQLVDYQEIRENKLLSSKPHLQIAQLGKNFLDLLNEIWQKAPADKTIKFDPATHPARQKIFNMRELIPEDNPYTFFYAPERENRPIDKSSSPTIKRTRAIRSIEPSAEFDMPFLQKLSILALIQQNSHSQQFNWNIGKEPQEEALKAYFTPIELTKFKQLFAQPNTKPESNPFQSIQDYEQAYAFLTSEDLLRTYMLIPNRFPLYSHHFLLINTQKDKPQIIGDEHELRDMLEIQKAITPNSMRIAFNSNNNIESQAGSSINVFHYQLANIGIHTHDFTLDVDPLFASCAQNYCRIGTLRNHPTTHLVFSAQNIGDISSAAFKFITVLNRNDIAYNIICDYAPDGFLSMMVSVRGDFSTNNKALKTTYDHLPGTFEMAGSISLTTMEKYLAIASFFAYKNNTVVYDLVRSWLTAASVNPQKMIALKTLFKQELASSCFF